MSQSLKVAAALFLFFAGPPALLGEKIPTRCLTEEFTVDAAISASHLISCNPRFPDDTLWHLDRVDSPDGTLDGSYDLGSARGQGAVVYVVDSGVMAAHDEFQGPAGSRVTGIDVTPASLDSRCPSQNRASDPCYANDAEFGIVHHGTAVASLVAGRNVGVAPDATIVGVKYAADHRATNSFLLLQALNAIIAHAWAPSTPSFQTAVVELSSSVNPANDPPEMRSSVDTLTLKIQDMIAGVDAHGMRDVNGKKFLFVVIGMNVSDVNVSDPNTPCTTANPITTRFPAVLGPSTRGLITVGGITKDNEWWSGGCQGPIEVLAPATGIFYARLTGIHDYAGIMPVGETDGTSFSGPIVAGVAALYLSMNPSLTPAQLEDLIESTAIPIPGLGAEKGFGRVVHFVPQPPPPRRRAIRP